MDDIISYNEYQKLSDEEKQNYDTHFPDGKSGTATRKRAKIPKVKSTIPVDEMKATEPGKTKTVFSKEEATKAGIKTSELPTQFELEHPTLNGSNRNVSDENGWIDNDGNVHTNPRNNEARSKAVESDRAADAEAKGKTETTDKANQMSNSSKVKINRIRNYLEDKTDTLATGKSINPFQKGKEAADAEALIDKDDATFNDKTIPEGPDGKESYYIPPLEAAEIKIAKTYGLNLENEGRPLAQITQGLKPSIAAKIINTDKELKENWETFLNNPRDLRVLFKCRDSIRELKDKNYKEMGFKSKSEYDQYVNYIDKSLTNILNRPYAGDDDDEIKDREGSKSGLNGLTTEEWVKAMKDEGLSEEETIKAYEKEGYSREGPRFKAAMKKHYKAQEPKKEAETETEKDEKKDPLEKAEDLEQPQTPTDIQKFSKDLNRFVIQAYLNGDFGKKSSPNAIASMGFFILDKLGTALVNASEVARGMSPSAKSQWSTVLDIQTDLLGKRITADWFLSQPREKQEALIRSGVLSGVPSASTIYNTIDPNAVTRAAQRDALETNKLSQEQKGVAQSNVNALLARKSELQTLITQLRSDQGWEVYTQAMNAIVGTAKGLNTLGVTDNSNSSSNKGFSDTLSVNVKTGKVTAAFVSGGISNNSTWNNSSAESLSKSNSLSQDALAYSKFKTGEAYANATREAKKAANEQLIKRLEGQIEIIDKCIDSWGKDLGL